MSSGSTLSRGGRQLQLGLFSVAFVCFVIALVIDLVRDGVGVNFYLMLTACVLMLAAMVITAARLSHHG